MQTFIARTADIPMLKCEACAASEEEYFLYVIELAGALAQRDELPERELLVYAAIDRDAAGWQADADLTANDPRVAAFIAAFNERKREDAAEYAAQEA